MRHFFLIFYNCAGQDFKSYFEARFFVIKYALEFRKELIYVSKTADKWNLSLDMSNGSSNATY